MMITDESGSDSDSVESTSSSYSSLSDFVIDIQNSDINGETPGGASGGTVEISHASFSLTTATLFDRHQKAIRILYRFGISSFE